MRRIRFSNLACPAASNYFKLPFSPHCRIGRVSVAQHHGESPETGAAVELYSSPAVATIIVGGSSTGYTPDYPVEELNPHIYRVLNAPLVITPGNSSITYYTDGNGIPYVDDDWRVAAFQGHIYVVISPNVVGTHWDLLFDIDRQ